MRNKMKEQAPQPERNLLQVRLSENEKRNIKIMAAGQGLTLREATLAAFTAWAEKLRAQAAAGWWPGYRKLARCPTFGHLLA